MSLLDRVQRKAEGSPSASTPSAPPAQSPPAPDRPSDDGAEKDGRAGRPNLTTDHVGCGGKHFNFAQFPYVGNPL